MSDTTKSVLCGFLVGLLSWCIVIFCFCVMASAEEVGESTSSGSDAGAAAADGEAPEEIMPDTPPVEIPPDSDGEEETEPDEDEEDEADAAEVFMEPVDLEYVEKLLEEANDAIAQVESRLATLTDAPAPPSRLFLLTPFADYTVMEGFCLLFLVCVAVAAVYHMFRRFV